MEPYPPFEKCKLTTITLVFTLNGSISVDPAFSLLPITHIEFSPPKRQKKKFDLPLCDIPGSILSMRYSGETRGIIRSTSTKYFKNSITIDISTATKNVSIKLSSSKIHMCGASSEEQATEGAQLLLNHILALQDELDWIKANPELAEKTASWLLNKLKGGKCKRVKYITEEDYVEEDDNSILLLDDFTDAPDMRIAKFLARQANEFEYHSYLASEIEWILSLEQITTRPLSIDKTIKVMVNYNYNLGFVVDRFALYEKILGKNGFVSSYDNCVEHCVKIKLPYVPDEDEGIVRRKNKIPCHCFLVYKSGVVTQTGPGGEKMKKAYDLFWETILEIKKYITLKIEKPKRKLVLIKRSKVQ